MGSKSKSPPPPDTVGAAKAEAAGNKEVAQITAGYNRPTQIDPYGQTSWSFKGDAAGQAAIQQQRDQALAELNRVLAIPKPLFQPRDGGANQQNQAAWQSQRDAAQAAYNQRIQALGGAMGTPDNPRPGDWVQTTTLSPQQAAILAAEQGNDLALQNLATQGVGIAQNVLGQQFNPNLDPTIKRALDDNNAEIGRINESLQRMASSGQSSDPYFKALTDWRNTLQGRSQSYVTQLGQNALPKLQGVSGIGASQFGIPTANFSGIDLPNFQGSAQGIPQYQGPQGAMPTYQGPAGNVPQATALGGQVPQFQGPTGAMPTFQGNTGQVAGITGPQGNMPQLGADQIGMAANRLNNMNRVNEDPNQFAQQRQQVSDALYNQLTRFSDQRFAREEAAERTRLSNMGFVQGTAAYDNALKEFRRSKDESYAGAANQAILAGGAEQSRLIGDLLASRQSNIGLGQAQFGQDQARYAQGLQERQSQFDAGMAGRGQTLQEQLAKFQTGLSGRQQVQQEALDRFGAGMGIRELQGQEAGQRFQAQLAGRGQQQSELESLFARQMGSRQQGVQEALNRFQTGMSGREQQLAEAATRQQALAQNYGLGLDERQTAFNAALARQGLAMDRTQAQLQADTNRYQLGLGERQAQQQSQMNQQALAAQQRQQLFQERAFERSLPLNEVTALMSGSGVTMPQFAGFQPMQSWQGPQLLSAELGRYNAQLGASNAAGASRGQNLAALGSLAGAAATFF